MKTLSLKNTFVIKTSVDFTVTFINVSRCSPPKQVSNETRRVGQVIPCTSPACAKVSTSPAVLCDRFRLYCKKHDNCSHLCHFIKEAKKWVLKNGYQFKHLHLKTILQYLLELQSQDFGSHCWTSAHLPLEKNEEKILEQSSESVTKTLICQFNSCNYTRWYIFWNFCWCNSDVSSHWV